MALMFISPMCNNGEKLVGGVAGVLVGAEAFKVKGLFIDDSFGILRSTIFKAL